MEYVPRNVPTTIKRAIAPLKTQTFEGRENRLRVYFIGEKPDLGSGIKTQARDRLTNSCEMPP